MKGADSGPKPHRTRCCQSGGGGLFFTLGRFLEMLIIIPAVLLIALFIWAFVRFFSGPSNGGSGRYSQTRNWIDFDPGVDEKKVGDPKYPTAGFDSAMKHEFLNDLMDDDKS